MKKYDKIPFDVIVKANKLGDTRFTGDSFKAVEVVAGEKCNNGGEYGFSSVFTKTSVPGVYYWTRTTTSEFECGTGPQGFVALSNDMVDRILAESKKVIDAADEMWMNYQWGDGDYPYYTGDSCEAEIAAIIKENN